MVIKLGLRNFCYLKMYDILFLIKIWGVKQEADCDLHVGY
jgi:hypothetical protein